MTETLSESGERGKNPETDSQPVDLFYQGEDGKLHAGTLHIRFVVGKSQTPEIFVVDKETNKEYLVDTACVEDSGTETTKEPSE